MNVDLGLTLGEEVEIFIPGNKDSDPPVLACTGFVDFLASEPVSAPENAPGGRVAFRVALRSAPNHPPYSQIYYDPQTLKCDFVRTSDVGSMPGQITRKQAGEPGNGSGIGMVRPGLPA